MLPISTKNNKLYYENLEDTKGLIRGRNSKKDSQYNGQKENYKRTNNDLQIEQHKAH